MSDKTFTMTLLFDFFGELLTEKQREYFDLYYNEDLSLSEIAEIAEISRQGVRDIIHRAETILVDMERKTGIVQRFSEMQSDIQSIKDMTAKIVCLTDGEANKLALTVMDKLEDLKG